VTALPVLRTSERSSFLRCPQQWWWAYRCGLAPKFKQADARWFGIGVHIAFAEWYKYGKRRGPHPAETFADWISDEIVYAKTWLDDRYEEAAWEDCRELGISMLEGYVNHWGRDSQWSIISVEQPFSIRVTHKGKPIAVFTSRWDAILRSEVNGRIYLLEHKTTNQVNTAYLAMDPQAGAYWAVADPILRKKHILKAGEEIAGIQYNFLRKAMKDERPQNDEGQYLNKNGSVSARQPPPRFVRPDPIERSPAERKTQLLRLADEVRMMNGIRAGELPILKNQTKDCPYCDFWDMCNAHERGGDAYKAIMKALYTQRDPYLDENKSSLCNFPRTLSRN